MPVRPWASISPGEASLAIVASGSRLFNGHSVPPRLIPAHFALQSTLQRQTAHETYTPPSTPLYTYDKHTAAGKKAITRFAEECREVRAVLAEHVLITARTTVALMAAFYADAVAISLRLDWPQSRQLEQLGFMADMSCAGCPADEMGPVLHAVRGNLGWLNECRRLAIQRQT